MVIRKVLHIDFLKYKHKVLFFFCAAQKPMKKINRIKIGDNSYLNHVTYSEVGVGLSMQSEHQEKHMQWNRAV